MYLFALKMKINDKKVKVRKVMKSRKQKNWGKDRWQQLVLFGTTIYPDYECGQVN